MISTAREIERMPESFSLERIQVGVGLVTSTFVAVRSTKLCDVFLPRIGAESVILNPKPSPPTSGARVIGSL